MMKPPNTKSNTLDTMMQFSGMCSGEIANKTIQELKEEAGKAKNPVSMMILEFDNGLCTKDKNVTKTTQITDFKI